MTGTLAFSSGYLKESVPSEVRIVPATSPSQEASPLHLIDPGAEVLECEEYIKSLLILICP